MLNYRHYLLFTLLGCPLIAQKYVPIVLVHGIISDDYGMAPTKHYIRKYMGKKVYVKNVKLGIGELTSLTNIYHQAEYLRKTIQKDPKLKNGFNFVVHSQGGLVARYYLQKYNDPPVLTYISWGSPQQGVFGMPGTLDDRFGWLDNLEEYAHHVLYSHTMQKIVGFAGYWRDTLHYKKYLKKVCFLPYLNNELPHKDAELFKKNICSLKNMILVMSTNEQIIEPVISCHFGFYKIGSKNIIEQLIESQAYQDDVLGLRTLNESGRLHFRLAQCSHVDYQEDEENFVNNGLEYLIADPDNVPLSTEIQT